MSAKVKKLLMKWGPQHLAKGIERGLTELDGVITGWPVQPSLVGNLAFTALGAIGAFMAPAPFDEIMAIWGGHHSTTLWDYLEGYIAPPAVRAREAMTFIPSKQTFVPTRPGLTDAIKYAPEQRVITAPKFIPGVLRPKYQHGA